MISESELSEIEALSNRVYQALLVGDIKLIAFEYHEELFGNLVADFTSGKLAFRLIRDRNHVHASVAKKGIFLKYRWRSLESLDGFEDCVNEKDLGAFILDHQESILRSL